MIQNVYDPQLLNRYSFERNNPQKHEDKDGHIAIIPLMAAGAIVGAVFNAGYYVATTNNFQWSGLATYAGSGAVQGGLSVLNPIGALFGGAIGETIEKAYEGEDITSLEGVFDIAAEGTLSAASFGLGKAFLPKEGIHKIKYLTSYFTTKTGAQFIGNQIAENLGYTAGSAAYRYGANINYANSYTNANQAGNSNAIFSPNIISSGGGGGGCRNCVTVRSEKDVRKIANQLAVDVYKSLTSKISQNTAKSSKSKK